MIFLSHPLPEGSLHATLVTYYKQYNKSHCKEMISRYTLTVTAANQFSQPRSIESSSYNRKVVHTPVIQHIQSLCLTYNGYRVLSTSCRGWQLITTTKVISHQSNNFQRLIKLYHTKKKYPIRRCSPAIRIRCRCRGSTSMFSVCLSRRCWWATRFTWGVSFLWWGRARVVGCVGSVRWVMRWRTMWGRTRPVWGRWASSWVRTSICLL